MELKILKLPELSNVEVWTARGDTRGVNFFHDTYSICTLLPGEFSKASWKYRGRRLISPVGSLMMMEPGEMHVTERVIGNGNYFVSRIPIEAVHEYSCEEDVSPGPHLRMATNGDGKVFRALVAFHTAVESNATGLEIESRFARVMSLFMRCFERSIRTEQGPCFERLAIARDYIYQNASKEISLRDLSALTGLSRFYFLRAFRKRYGLPPHAYQLQMRVTQAMAAMSRGDMNLVHQFGFSDQSHFIRHFKQVMRITPGRYAYMVHRPISGFSGAGL